MSNSTENNLPMDNIYEKFRQLIVSDMAETIKVISQAGRWDEPPTKITDGMSADEIARAAIEAAAKAMDGEVPVWFSSSASAMRSVLLENETLGLECAAALYESTKQASSTQRMDALRLLLEKTGDPSKGGSALGIFGAM